MCLEQGLQMVDANNCLKIKGKQLCIIRLCTLCSEPCPVSE